MDLINSTFRRICEIASMCGLTIKELSSGEVDVHLINDNSSFWNSWKWENKEQFLVGDQYDMSLFRFIVDECIPYYSFLSHKRYANFIDLCKMLKGCRCIEELALNMDLMGI